MKTFIITLLACAQALGAGFFAAQQAVIGASSSVAAPFDPADYGTVALWGGARYETSYADNDAVGTLADFSGNSRTATQGTAAAKPTFKAAGSVSGVSLATLYFDSSDYVPTTSFAQSQPFTIAVVARSATTAANNTAIGSSSGFVGVAARTTGSWLSYAGGGITYYGTSTGWSVIVSVFNGASSFTYVNGSKSTGSYGAGGISGGVSIGAWNTGSEKFNGHIGEWVVWSGALSDTDAAAACAALQADWGL